MAGEIGAGFGIDLTSFIANADKADKKLQDMVVHAQQLETSLSNALNSMKNTSALGVLNNIQSQMKAINEIKVGGNIDTSRFEQVYGILDKTVGVMKTLSEHNSISFIDDKEIYEDNKILFEHQNELAKINKLIDDLRKNYGNGIFGGKKGTMVMPDDFNVAEVTKKKDGTQIKEGTAAYSRALNAGLKSYYDIELKKLLELKEKEQAYVNWHSKTFSGKSTFLIGLAKKEAAEQAKEIKTIQTEYSKLAKSAISTFDQIQKHEKTIAKSESTGVDASKEKAQLDQMLKELAEKYERLEEMESQHGNVLVQQIENFWIKANERDRRGLDEKIKIYQEKQKQYLQTPEGAIAFSNSADSINEEKEAINVLIAARDNLSKSSEKYKQTIDDLNNRIQKHRISVEQLSTAEKNETTLQPTIRNEYARLLKEIDKVIKEKEALAKTSAYQSGDADASKHYDAILAREQDLQRRIQEIKDNAGDLLAETERKHASDVASNFLAEVTKAEAARLEMVKQKLAEEMAERSKYGSISGASANRLVAITSNASNIQQEEEAIKKLKDARAHLNKEDADYQQTLDKLNSEIEQHEHNIKLATDATYRKQQIDKRNSTYDGSIQYAKEATTVEQYAKAIEYLEKARKKENVTTAEGKKRYEELGGEIASLKNKMEELNGQQDAFKEKSSGLLNITDQLTRRFALLFSVSAITGYIKKLSEVRGEFELQQRSLQVLLGSKKEANELWNKTAELAVRSPFRVKELVTYTKQLAAYRVEAHKLYDTNKMLADISAGLGVDMNRLILAYGQVKAANFLRGTELRQFSEAGVNLLQLLSEYYSTIEDKAVSVGDVFDRVSKRMVSFRDVEHVLKGVTEAGGMFYKMQEKQSETLKGEISNLKDSLELMLNEIGESNEGIMKNSVNFAKTLLDNYEKLIPVLKAIITLLALTKLNAVLASKSMINLATGLGVITEGSTKALKVGQLINTLGKNILKTFSDIWKMAVSNPWAAVITAILAIVVKIASTFRKVKKEIKEIQKEANSLREEASQIELKFNVATEKVDIDEAKEQINALISFAKENYNLKLSVDFSELDKAKKKEDKFRWLNDKINDLRYEIRETSAFVTTFNEVLAKMGGFHIGDDINKDAEQLSESSSTLITAFERDASIIEAKYLEVKKLGGNLTQLQPIYDKIKEAQDEAFDYNKITKYREAFDLLFKTYNTEAEHVANSNHWFSMAGIIGRKERDIIKREFTLESGFTYDSEQVADAMVDYDSKMQEFLNEWDNFEAKMNIVIPPFIDEEESKKRWKSAIDKWVTDNGYNILMKQTAYSLKGIPFEEETDGNVDEDPEATKEREKEALNQLKKQIQLIREAARAYDEMRKSHNKAYADEHIQSEYKGAFREAGLGNISNYSFGTREDELNNLNKLRGSASAVKGGMLELEKATARVGVQVDNLNQELADQKLFDQISDLFSNYEISLEMDKLNIPPDLAKRLFGLDAISLDELRPAILEKFNLSSMKGMTNEQIYESGAFKAMSEERQKELKESLDKEAKMTKDARMERLKTYSQYLVKEQHERIKLKMEEIRKIAEIEAMEEFTPEEKKIMKANIQRETKEEMAKSYWEDFEKTPMFLNLFDDIDKATTQSLTNMKVQLEGLRKSMASAGLPASDLKEILDKINQVEEELERRDPFGKLKSARAVLFGANDKNEKTISKKDYENAKIDEADALSKAKSLKAQEENQLKLIEGKKKEADEAERLLNTMQKGSEDYILQEGILSVIREEYNGLVYAHSLTVEQTKENNEKLTEAQDITRRWKEQVEDTIEVFRGVATVASEIGNSFIPSMEEAGAISEEVSETLQDLIGYADSLSGIFENLATKNYSSVFTAIISLMASEYERFQDWVDEPYQNLLNDAEKAEEIYDDLVESFEDLKEAMEDAYTTEQMLSNKGDMEKNLDEQSKALEEQIAFLKMAKDMEEGKKNPDQDRLDELDEDIARAEENLEKLDEQREEFQRQMTETLGGTYDYAGVAESFLDAWLTAFEETGDGLSGLDEAFDDFFKNVLKKQVIYNGATAKMEPYITKVNEALADGVLDDEELRQLEELGQKTKEDVSNYFDEANKIYGLADFGGDKLSALQAGIQGITEEQADVLAGYWNAVRSDVSAIRNIVQNYLSAEANIHENPLLPSLRTVATQTEAIFRLLNSAVGTNVSENDAINVRVVSML